MGLISEYQEFGQAIGLALPYLDSDRDDITPERKQLVREAELEAADVHFFATLFRSEMDEKFKDSEDCLATSGCFSGNFWNYYRKWLFQGNDKALTKWHAHILALIGRFEGCCMQLYPNESIDWIRQRLSQVSKEKLTARYGGDRFDAIVEANR